MKRFLRAPGGLLAAAGILVVVLVSLPVSGRSGGLSARRSATSVIITNGDRTVLEYRFGEVPFKPYAAQLYTPAGTPILRDSPRDHKHHHGLMFAVWAEGVNFWEEKPDSGKEIQQALGETKISSRNGVSVADLAEQLDWTVPSGDTLLHEARKITTYSAPELGATLLTWSTRLEPAAGKQEVKLSGQYYDGLGMRFVESMNKEGQFLFADNSETLPGKEHLTRANWAAYSSVADGKPVTVAIFDHPQNVRHPAYMFTLLKKPFSYLSATLHVSQEPLAVSKDQPLALRYGVAVWDGSRSAAEIQKLYDRWVALESNLSP